MRKIALDIAENYAEMKELCQKNGFGTVSLHIFIGIAAVIGLVVWTFFAIFILFQELRERKTDHRLSYWRYVYATRPHISKRLLLSRDEQPYVRSRMGR